MTSIADTLRSGGKRPRIYDAQMVTKVPQRAKDLVNQVATAQGVSEATIVRDALADYLERRGYRS